MVSHFGYSSQYFYHQSAHADADQMIHTSNRLRAESGSSESSRGSGSTGSAKSRRRSHRPRGCRGGSNRRRNNVCDGKKKVPQYKASTDLRGHDAIRGNSFTCSSTNVASRYDVSFIPHNVPYQLQGMYSGYSNANEDSGYYDFLPSRGVTNINHHINEHLGRCAGFGNTEFPSLRTSFSDSSNEMIPGYDDSQILPPMPTNAFQDQRPIPTGPNPYALNISTSAKSVIDSARIGHHSARAALLSEALSEPPTDGSSGTEPNSHHPGILQPLQKVYSRHNINFGEMVTEAGKDFAFFSLDESVGINADQDNVYRAQRLDKQRQNVLGGSLFVTSPRSFLMGVKKLFHEPSGTTGAPALHSY
jgi:hypothetical protein